MGMTIDNSCEKPPMSREEVVETLKTMVFGVQAFERFNAKEREALDYAISSLKTDEAYQVMYEGGEIYTKADLVAMLTELQLEIEELKSYESADGQDLAMLADIGILFQQKINKLKGEEDGTNKKTSD